ncbi:MAG: hypothetical protein ICV74_06915 [Thermoleophilia bacterium]|nr:hypothetical protein [Thermoleophilia bacterium]
MTEERNPEEALDEIREKEARGESASADEEQFLETERVRTESDATRDRSDEGRGTATY